MGSFLQNFPESKKHSSRTSETQRTSKSKTQQPRNSEKMCMSFRSRKKVNCQELHTYKYIILNSTHDGRKCTYSRSLEEMPLTKQ